jgi:AcrR family transcriptional regulator
VTKSEAEDASIRGPLRARQKQFTQEILLTAAVDVFAEIGYATATVEEIARAAGTSRPTFYQHFKSKAEVAIELLAWLQAQVEPLHDQLFAIDQLTWAAVRTWIQESIEAWDLVRVRASVVRQAAAVDPAVSALLAGHAVAQTDAMAEFFRSRNRDLSREDARIHAALLLTQFDAALTSLQMLGMSPRSNRIIEALADEWWSVLIGAETPRDVDLPHN